MWRIAAVACATASLVGAGAIPASSQDANPVKNLMSLKLDYSRELL